MAIRRGRRGAALTDSFRIFTSRPATFVLLGLGVVGAAAVWLIWRPVGGGIGALDPLDEGNAAAVWGSISVLLLGALALGRLVPVDPRKWRDEVGEPLKAARKGIDLIYVATYLRIDRGSGIRTRVVARFRAVLRAAEGRYDRVVVVAHSQGSMYAIATLFGDGARDEKEGGSGWGGCAPGWKYAPALPASRSPC